MTDIRRERNVPTVTNLADQISPMPIASGERIPGDRVGGRFSMSRGAWIAFVAALLAFIILALILAATRPPQSDEGHFANAGAALAFQGRFIMPMWTSWIPTLDQRVYSNMPLYFLALAAWFKIFGVSWLVFRALSVVFGAVLVVSLIVVLQSVSTDRRAVVAGLVLVAFNYDIINLSSARYDVMIAALSMSGLAVYLVLRERSLDKALFGANSLLAAACLTHPFALFGMVGLAIFVLTLDFRRLRTRHIVASVVPYFVALAAWGIYIAQDPGMFRAQFGENARGRLGVNSGLLEILRMEFRERYLSHFAGWRPGVPAAMRTKTLLLVAYCVGIVGCVAMRAIRRNPFARALVIYTVTSIVLLALVDNNRWYIYLIYVLPLLALCLALVAGEWEREGGWRRWSVRVGLAAYALFAIASVGYRARLDVHHGAFLPAVRYLQAHVRDGDTVMAGGEFGLGLGFERHVVDDPRFGYLSGKTPEFLVLSTERSDLLQSMVAVDPAFRQFIDDILAHYRLVFESSAGSASYRIWARQGRPNADNTQQRQPTLTAFSAFEDLGPVGLR